MLFCVRFGCRNFRRSAHAASICCFLVLSSFPLCTVLSSGYVPIVVVSKGNLCRSAHAASICCFLVFSSFPLCTVLSSGYVPFVVVCLEHRCIVFFFFVSLLHSAE
jgi:hypothetical protein